MLLGMWKAMKVKMPIQYITDPKGKKVAVVVPLEEWEALQEELDKLTPAEARASDALGRIILQVRPSLWPRS